MRRLVIAVGRAQDEHLTALWSRYAGRSKPPLELRVVEDKRRTAPDGKLREARLLLDAVPDGAIVVALDERGELLDSPGFARKLGGWRDQGKGQVAFLIGGADGLHESVLARAQLVLSFGRMTWPHQLARIMLAEQLYRAETILAGHPYHRE